MATIYDLEYILEFRPTITNQGSIDNCVAHAICNAKQILEYKEHGRTQRYSIDWVYGNRLPTAWQGDGYDIEDGLDKLISDGVPPYNLLPDQNYYSTAKQRVLDNYNNLINVARNYKISSWEVLGGLITEIINGTKECLLSNNGVPILCIWGTTSKINSYTTTSGIVNNYNIPDEEKYNYHCLVIIGWKIINGQEYWICSNSWGEYWGDNGLCYISPHHNSIRNNIVIWDAYTMHLLEPTGVKQNVIGTSATQISLSWNPAMNAEKYNIYIGEFANQAIYLKTVTDTNAIIYKNEVLNILGGNNILYLGVSIASWNSTIRESEMHNRYALVFQSTTLPEYILHTINQNSVYIKLDSSYFYENGYWVYWKYDNEPVENFRFIERIYTTEYTFTGLQPNTKYTFRIKGVRQLLGGDLLGSFPLDLTYTTLISKPTQFQWLYNVNSGYPFSTNMPATEWKRLQDKVNEWLKYKGKIVYDFFSYYHGDGSFTTPISGQPFYHYQFNQVKGAIDSMISTGLTIKSSGNQVKASDLKTLVNKLNLIT